MQQTLFNTLVTLVVDYSFTESPLVYAVLKQQPDLK